MSNTKRNTEFANLNARQVRHHNYRAAELAAYEAMIDAGFVPTNRQRSAQNRIADNYNDYSVSGYREGHKNK